MAARPKNISSPIAPSAQTPGKAKPRSPALAEDGAATEAEPAIEEIGGPKGPEPTRYGDWERKGRCSDF